MHCNKTTKKITSSGFVTLLFVLIVGAVGMAVAISLVLLGVGSSKSSLALNYSHQARALADGCAERGLERIRDENSFTGTINLVLGLGNCSYTVADLGGENRQVTASGTVGTVVRKVQITLDKIKPKINITAWDEIP